MKNQKPSAFSLLELLVVISLMVGFMGFMGPTLFRATGDSLNNKAREIVEYVENLRFLSILNNKPFKLVFDFEHKESYVESRNDSTWERVENFNPLTFDDDVKLVHFKSGSKITDVLKVRTSILPFGYVQPFEVVLEKDVRKLAVKITTVLGESIVEEVDNFTFN